jgi:stress-induced morphogen
MPMTEAEILRLIKDALPDAYVELKDLRGEGDHFQAYVESRAFVGKTLVQQHQMVYDALQGRVGGVLKALTLTTATPQKAS